MMDRIDIHIEVPSVDYDKLSDNRLGEPSATIQARVDAARECQRMRFEGTNMTCNADMGPAELRQFCPLDKDGSSLMRNAMKQMQLSARGYHRVLKLARSIADLAGDNEIQTPHLAEALQYRPKMELI